MSWIMLWDLLVSGIVSGLPSSQRELELSLPPTIHMFRNVGILSSALLGLTLLDTENPVSVVT